MNQLFVSIKLILDMDLIGIGLVVDSKIIYKKRLISEIIHIKCQKIA